MPFFSFPYENWQNEKAVCLPLHLDSHFLQFSISISLVSAIWSYCPVSVLDFQPVLISIAPLQVMELEGRKDLFS